MIYLKFPDNTFNVLLQALEEDGHDANEFLFEVNKGTPVKKGSQPTTGNESDASVEKIDSDMQEAAPVVVEEQTKKEEAKKEEVKAPIGEPKPQRVEEKKKEEFAKPDPVSENKDKEAQDNEDSLNLTIGEEDEKLFNDDVSIYSALLYQRLAFL